MQEFFLKALLIGYAALAFPFALENWVSGEKPFPLREFESFCSVVSIGIGLWLLTRVITTPKR